MMTGKKTPLIISNADRSDESGTHWWSILNISPKSEFLFFDSFGKSGMKRFIVTDEKRIVGKVIKGLELTDKKDDNLTLIKLKFSVGNLQTFQRSARLFHLIYSFDKNGNITNFVNVWMLQDPIQMDTTITCGPF